MPMEYYIKALEKIPESELKLKLNLKFLYFFEEEDREKVKQNVALLESKFPQFKFTPIDTSIVDYEQVFIMSYLKYCVLANSTFSWWGAYLNTRKDKKVFYPEVFFAEHLKSLDVSDKFPDEWTCV